MAVLRKDGDVTVYVLQTKHKGKEEWFNASLDHFGTPEGFSASHDCWQQTGINGTFDKFVGMQGLTWMANRHVGQPWRLAKIRITQETVAAAALQIG